MMKRIVLSMPGTSCAIKNPSFLCILPLHQVVKMELLDHGLAVSADLVGHVVKVHGVKGVDITLKAAGVVLFFGELLRISLL